MGFKLKDLIDFILYLFCIISKETIDRNEINLKIIAQFKFTAIELLKWLPNPISKDG